MKNIIPQKFKKIIAKMNIKTNINEVGDIIHVSKNSYNELIALNIRNGNKANMFVSMLRNSEIATILEIIK